MRRLSRVIARSSGWFSRRLGRGGGTTVPGVVLLKLRPNVVAEESGELRHGTVLCSATNGKTTTTRLLAAATRATGYNVVTNAQGSNLERGIAAAFLSGDTNPDLGVFEVDEAALSKVALASQPKVLMLMNLFRDQLDRYGELETLLEQWRELLTQLDQLAEPPTLVLNADDPNIADLGRGRSNVLWFGLNDVSHGLEHRDHAADATTCRQCGAALTHTVVMVGHLGHWQCPTCDAKRPTPTVYAKQITLSGHGQSTVISYPTAAGTAIDIEIESSLQGLHNSYNLTAAFAASYALSLRTQRPQEPHTVARIIGSTRSAFGRGETIEVNGNPVQLLLAKNPTGVNQNLRTVMQDDGPLHVLVLLNDRTADGQDVSWIWDVDWEPLEPRLASLTLGGDRAWDLALRFRYGGFPMDKVKVSPDVAKALDVALAGLTPGETLHAFPTYTAMLDLRWVLTERGHAAAYWTEDL